MTDTDIDFAAIEARARQLRAETLAYGWSQAMLAIKTVVAKRLFPENLGDRIPA